MILDQKFPTDVRVENEAMSLIKNGFEVFLFCYTYNNNEPLKENYKGLQINRMNVSRKNVRKMRGLVNVLPIYEKFLYRKIYEFILKNGIEILHVHDLYLLGVCLKLKKETRIKIVSDLHENYVEGLKHYRFANSFPGNILISIKKWQRVEVEWLNNVDKIIVVVEEAVQRLKSSGIGPGKITVVENYLNYRDYDKFAIDENIQRKYDGEFVLSYIGAIDFHRGIHTVVEALEKLKSKNLPLRVIIVGSGRVLNELKEMASSYRLGNRLEFLGHQPHKLLRSYVEVSSIGLIPHLKTGHTDNTLPHKLFHYMYLKKPVLVSNCNPLTRIVEHCECGRVFTSNDSTDLALNIEWFVKNREKLATMGMQGHDALMSKYNWYNAEQRLIELYENIE